MATKYCFVFRYNMVRQKQREKNVLNNNLKFFLLKYKKSFGLGRCGVYKCAYNKHSPCNGTDFVQYMIEKK